MPLRGRIWGVDRICGFAGEFRSSVREPGAGMRSQRGRGTGLARARDGEVQVSAGELLGREHDLSDVVVSVGDDVKDLLGDRGGAALGLDGLEEPRGGEGGDDGGCVVDGGPEQGEELGAGVAAGGAELGVAYADVGLGAESVDVALAEVSGEMEDDVSDGVFVFGAARPELVFGESVETLGYGFDGVGEFAGGGLDEEGGEVVWHEE